MKEIVFRLSDGREISEDELEEKWEVDFEPGELQEIPRAFQELEIDGSLCSFLTIGKTRDGEFLVWWSERHPELGTYDEYFQKRSDVSTSTQRSCFAE
jgi:hypothetical protein